MTNKPRPMTKRSNNGTKRTISQFEDINKVKEPKSGDFDVKISVDSAKIHMESILSNKGQQNI